MDKCSSEARMRSERLRGGSDGVMVKRMSKRCQRDVEGKSTRPVCDVEQNMTGYGSKSRKAEHKEMES